MILSLCYHAQTCGHICHISCFTRYIETYAHDNDILNDVCLCSSVYELAHYGPLSCLPKTHEHLHSNCIDAHR